MSQDQARGRRSWMIWLSLLVVPALLLVFPVGCMVFGIRTTEEASYEVLSSEEGFELREYAEVVIAETVVDASFDDAGSVAFRRLFKYITGENESSSDIAMTAPVLADVPKKEGEKIAMTAPVVGERSGDAWRFAFVLPAGYTEETAPRPTNPEVKIRVLPRKKVAALRYSGSWSEEAVVDKTRELREWMQAESLEPVSEPRAAAFDPPWTIPFLRRNEILIDVGS